MQEGDYCWGGFVLCGKEGRTDTWDISPCCGFWGGGLTTAKQAEGWRLGGCSLSCPTTRTCPRVARWLGTSAAAPCESQPCGNFSSRCRLPSTTLLPILVFGLFLNPALRKVLGCGGHFTITLFLFFCSHFGATVNHPVYLSLTFLRGNILLLSWPPPEGCVNPGSVSLYLEV